MSDTMQVFDRTLVRRRREKAAAGIGAVAPILDAAAERLLDRLDDTTRSFTRALEIGGRGSVAPALKARGIPSWSQPIWRLAWHAVPAACRWRRMRNGCPSPPAAST
ncbi:hypothetical protein ACFQU7_04120 [Pseudoroseomonas wenyumeiae]